MRGLLKTQMQWPALAQDLALLTSPNAPSASLDDLCASYGIDRQELKDLIGIPYFQQLFDASLQEVQKQGSKAGVRYRSMFLAQSLAEMLYRKANSGDMKDTDALKLLDSLLKAAGIDSKDAGTQVNVQANIALPFSPGIKKTEQFLEVGA